MSGATGDLFPVDEDRMIAALADRMARMSGKEQRFVQYLVRYNRPLTGNQSRYLSDIYARVFAPKKRNDSGGRDGDAFGIIDREDDPAHWGDTVSLFGSSHGGRA